MRCPQLAVRGQPVVELGQGLGPDAVEPSLAVNTRLNHACFLEDTQMFGNGRLSQRQPIDEIPHWSLAVPEQVENRLPGRLTQDLEDG